MGWFGRRVIIVAVLGMSAATAFSAGCLRIVDPDDDQSDRDAVVPVDAPVDAIDAQGDSGNPLTDCAIPLPCPAPQFGRATLCGRIYDTESDDVVEGTNPTRQACTAATASGPCSLRVRYFDAIDFAGNPNGAQAFVPQDSVVDDCGRFRGRDMPRASLGFLSIAIDDAPGITPTEPHRLTNVVFSNAIADGSTNVRAYTTRTSTDQLWTIGAGINGMTFAQRGVLLKVFLYHGQPVAGVTVTRNSSQVPDDDFYFSDPGVTRRTIAPGQTATGANGSILVINSPSPIEYSGVGGVPSGCQWPSNLGAATPGVISVDRREAETTSGAMCP